MMQPDTVYDLIYQAPCMALGVCFDRNAIACVTFLPLLTPLKPSLHPLAGETVRQLDAYFANADFRFTLPFQFSGTPHQESVWREIAAIPKGKVATYSDIACKLQSGPRAVGNACGRNPLPVLIPCHRVVGKQGIGGFNQGKTDLMLDIKRWLLQHEGIQ